ncbi:hypothetical protein [Spirosoma sp.]|uniref:hypothetical protein n=1 Tax=Spirosoma sp. TaxID=1899569 RepID=UPI0026050BA6|nr:hypothetical protein [Spirosoma sp.]MCX6216781.1 hypothetical protein [Spirosoma sp.]
MYTEEFWNTRYQNPAYIYGVEPNSFFNECIDSLKPGRLLLPAEGEGRNALHAGGIAGLPLAVFYENTA